MRHYLLMYAIIGIVLMGFFLVNLYFESQEEIKVTEDKTVVTRLTAKEIISSENETIYIFRWEGD